MNKHLLQIIGVIFLMITTSAASREPASVRQKDNPQPLNNSTNKTVKQVLARATKYNGGDPDTEKGKTASLVPIKTVTDMGLKVIAVDPNKIPYGSVIIYKDRKGDQKIGVAVDTGSAVKERRAAKELARLRGFGTNSAEYNAPVVDVYGNQEPSTEWTTVTVVVYDGPCFKNKLDSREKIEYLKTVKTLYMM